jgi:integrase
VRGNYETGNQAFSKRLRFLTIRGLGDGIGWHTFRHTYRAWLDATGAPIGVQQKLMRHAQVSTTMNIYGNALMTSKRKANSKVARMALRPALLRTK